jgi:hypothetical protein
MHMAQPAWKRPGSPIGKKGPRKANPKYKRRAGERWESAELRKLKELAKANTPTGVISLKLQRPPATITRAKRGTMTYEKPSGWMKDPRHEKFLKPPLYTLVALLTGWAFVAWRMH